MANQLPRDLYTAINEDPLVGERWGSCWWGKQRVLDSAVEQRAVE
jgi:hypothetical protein